MTRFNGLILLFWLFSNLALASSLNVGLIQRTVEADLQGVSTVSIEAEVPLMAFREMGYTPSVRYDNYPRMIRALVRGELDAATVLSYKGKRMSRGNAGFRCHYAPYVGLPLQVYKLKGNALIPDHVTNEELNRFSVGYLRTVERNVDPFINRPNFIPANDMRTLFKMLKAKRIDTVFSDVAITNSWARKLDFSPQSIMDVGFLEAHMCFSTARYGVEQAQTLADRFYEALQAVHKRGEIAQFLDNQQMLFYSGLYLPEPNRNASN